MVSVNFVKSKSSGRLCTGRPSGSLAWLPHLNSAQCNPRERMPRDRIVSIDIQVLLFEFLLLCLCTPFKTTGGLRTHRHGVEARQLAADFAEAPPESIRLEHLHRPAKGREKADRRLVRGKVEDDDAVTRSLHDLVPDKARERSGSLGVDAHLHEEVARTRSFEASHLGSPQRAKVEAGGPLERLIGNLRILDSRDAIDARRAIDAGEQVPGAGFAYQSVRFDDAFDDAIQ